MDENVFKTQNNKTNIFVLLFLYRTNMKINLAIIDIDVAVYGIIFNSVLIIL